MREFFMGLFGDGMAAQYGTALWDTLKITLLSTILAYIIGVPLGILLYGTAKDSIFPNRTINSVTGVIVNIIRSVPFIILLVMIQPIAKLVVGTKMGDRAFIFYLVVAAAPFVARMVESSLREVDRGAVHGFDQLADHLEGGTAGSKTVPARRRCDCPDHHPRLYADVVPDRRRWIGTACHPVRTLSIPAGDHVYLLSAADHSRADRAGGAQSACQTERQTDP